MDLSKQVNDLFAQQQEAWPQLRQAIDGLSLVKTRQLEWGADIHTVIQLNPARMVSASAKIDTKTIGERPCFLCEKNRPEVQKGIPFLEKYIILCNPFPILHNHLTIPIHSHVPQRIRKKFGDMLELAVGLPDYVVFYNGPKCGASAPDHFHLQAGLKSPVLMQGDNELRPCFRIETPDRTEAEEAFESIYLYMQSHQPDEEEPMMNVVCWTEDNHYIAHVFPRKMHRPYQYHEQGVRQLMISPGALDLAGMIITVRQEDFDNITKNDVEDIFAQVSMPII